MGKITFVMPDDTEEKFRKAVGLMSGSRKGALGIALTQGAEMWLNKNSPRILRSFSKTKEGLNN